MSAASAADPSLVPLSQAFFEREALAVARDLLGVRLITDIEGVRVVSAIVETEAYHQSERGCHCYGGKRTKRTTPMFAEGGRSYVYFIYGMHWALNLVTGPSDVGQAVLIRAVVPLDESVVPLIHQRRRFAQRKRPPSRAFLADPWRWCDGPGKVCQALAITGEHNDRPLESGQPLWVTEGRRIAEADVVVGPRVGIDYAGEDAQLPWRFQVRPGAAVR